MDCSEFRDSLPEVGEPPKKVCAVCQNPASKQCAACKGVDYCSAEHQKSHWKVHKKTCSPIEFASSPEFGRHFVATRDLPSWTLLLTELPVLVNPRIKDCPHSCISCCSILPSAPWTCSKCSTPFFCNKSCSMVLNKIHSEFECGILSKCNKKQRDKICSTEKLGYLRAIHLKNNDSETWTKVLEMPGADKYKSGDESEDDKWFIREILPLLGEKGVGFEADMVKLLGIYERGALMGRYTMSEDQGSKELLYLRANEFAHNCFPNCTPIIGKCPEFKMQVRNTIEVKKGTILSIDFGVISYCVGAMAQKHLQESSATLCICPRCTDPTGTELGTMLSAVKCTKRNCQDGYLLPVDVEDMSENAPWRCNRSGCKGKGTTWEGNVKIVSKCMRDIQLFRENVPLGDVERTREFWELLKKRLHPNHYVVRAFEKDLAYELHEMMDQKMEFSISRMDLHIEMIEHLLKMVDMIDPGISLARASFLRWLFDGLNQRLAWYAEAGQGAVQIGLMKRSIEVIDTVLSIAKFYPEIMTPSTIQNLMERRRTLQMTLISTY